MNLLILKHPAILSLFLQDFMIFKVYKMNPANHATSCNPVSLFTGFHDFQGLQDESC
jgi:hypothetical protein